MGALLSAYMFGQCSVYVNRKDEQVIWLCGVVIGVIAVFYGLGSVCGH